jgi:diguanylate cyclase (GGDEF)-like protein/PAS domain S-box-containing protein
VFAPHASEARLRPFVGAAVLLTSVLVVSLVIGLTVRGHDDTPVVGAVVAVLAGYVAARLIGLAWSRHRKQPAGACRTVGWHGVGVGILALTGLFTTAGLAAGVPEGTVANGIAAGLTLSSAAFLPGLLLMPGAATTMATRIRRALDGVSVGVCLLFTSWVLMIAPLGSIDSLGFWMATLTCCALAIAAVTALRPSPARRAAALCAGGVAAIVVGLNGLAFDLANNCPPGWCTLFGTLLVAGAGLIWAGSRRGVEIVDVAGPEPAGITGYPLLAVPMSIAVVVGLHRLITGADFDRPSVLLGVLAIVAVTVRESLAARDVARFARRIAEQEAQFRSLVAGSTDVIMVLGRDLTVRWQSTAAARQFGLSDQEVVGRHFQSMVHPDDVVRVANQLADVRARGLGLDGDSPDLIEARLRDGFGRWRETESAVSDLTDVPEVSGIVVHIRDVGERKEMERALHRYAYADQLTGLANRRQLMMSIVAQRCSPLVRGALMVIELDGFNAVNDVRGYDIGDAVLVEVARRLRAGSAETDLPARLSGDEFAVVTEAGAVQAYALATRLLTMLAEPISLPGVTVHLSASIGMTELAGGSNGDDVMRRADLALRRAKQLGRGRVEWFDEEVEQAIVRRMTLEQDLPEAMVKGQFDLLYQPIMDLVRGRPFAVEALLRWRHPGFGTLLPFDVIPVAEDLGLMPEIGGWVIQRATRQLATWLREGRDLSMAINVSPHQLPGPELVADVGAALELHKFPADRLVLELAERGLADGGATEERVGQLRSLGVRTALDEFGTGVQSLAHLRGLPIDMVKIGPTFFDNAQAAAGHSVPLIDVMVGLGRRLGFDVVAQGLEAPAHLETVRGAGCRLGQGHLFARPQPAERTEAYLDGFPARSG